MNGKWTCGLLLALAFLGAGCKEERAVPAAPVDPGEPTQAQPKLQTIKLYVGPEEVITELALSGQEVRTGMMFRTNMAENTAMLFVMPTPQQASFWMKNCPLPLSIAYLDSDGIIREIHDLQPFNTNAVVSTATDIRFALETPQGWFKRHNIREGVAVASSQGPLLQTFFGRRR